MSRPQHPNWIMVILIVTAAALFLVLYFDQAQSGGPDDGLLHLAGATALLRDGGYPIIQRPPLYSLLLAGFGALYGISVSDSSPLAQELGSIETFDVAQGLLSPAFLRSVLIFQVLLWSASVLMLALMLRRFEVRWRWIYLAIGMALLPSSWRMVGLLSETILCQFLMMVGVSGIIFTSPPNPFSRERDIEHHSVVPLLIAATAFAVMGLTKATFQLIAPILVFGCLMFMLRRDTRRRAFTTAVMLFVPWLLIVGGWSLRNQASHGFIGVSGVGGVALSTRTALYLERAEGSYLEEVAIFRSIRDQLFIDTVDKNNVVYWGARASNWLMENRGWSYLEANRFLTAFNLSAIRAAPLNYFDTVSSSLVYFHFPGVSPEWSTLPRLLFSALEFVLMICFTIITSLWMSLHILARIRQDTFIWTTHDSMILLLLVIFWYTAIISSAMDVGKPEHRMTVQLVIPLVIMLGGKRILGFDQTT